MIMRSETDGFSTQKEKVIYITQPEQKKKVGLFRTTALQEEIGVTLASRNSPCSVEESEVQIH